VDDLVAFWSDQNIRVYGEFINIRLARAHMMEMGYGIDDIGGLDLVAEDDGKAIAVGWIGVLGSHALSGMVVMFALGVDPERKADLKLFDTVVEEMLEFARKTIIGDERLGRFRRRHDPDVRA